ncbi:hypothetical protein CH352_02455 [Leptospira hartskeerlii]|uniref:Uncharacterized protein n=1 Tax=Leptospira hartskeerlii TaxID=2023177 RepID=A0A2M9XDB2_9LEPT|nr:hypothetical protein [Leptospira hartskeerlii]PJZ25686.1 hypothetical protein CH357_08520 [Leptospira hartskeerlii]PJZ35491.1 hypothetical protein CH352_02455 [Leptospira hartskeerlii]
MMPTTESDPDFTSKGQVAFEEFKLPAIEAGEYTLTVKQFIANSDQPVLSEITQTEDPAREKLIDQFETIRSFAVRGERFKLSPEEIQSVFPPENTTGEYFNVLPHIVLSQPTLPWQRSALHDNFNVKHPETITGWLALMVFDQFDPVPNIVQGVISDLYSKTAVASDGNLPAGIASYSFLPDLDYGEKSTDQIQYIDVPLDLFYEICPTIQDIRWLTHVRKVNTSSKSQSQQQKSVNDETDLATIVANRLPVMGRSSTVHLISLEKMENYLPNQKGIPNTPLPSGTTHVRLVSLKKWSFQCMKESKNFSTYLKELDAGPFQLPDAKSGEAIKGPIKMGYTAVDHLMREGGKTVSWYRSPLVPFRKATKDFNTYESADAAYRYNPESGMFDVSYAVAWQLGKMESLSNPDISGAIHEWKNGKLYELIKKTELNFLKDLLYGKENKTEESAVSISRTFQNRLVQTSIKALSDKVALAPKKEIKLPQPPPIPKS